jgi:hypothetical protein
MTEFVQHRTVLGKHQQQRQNPRKTQSTHIRSRDAYREAAALRATRSLFSFTLTLAGHITLDGTVGAREPYRRSR